MRHSQWLDIVRKGEQLKPSENQIFALADGKTCHGALGKVQLLYGWHDMMWSLETYIIDDDNLAFPIILGLDFLTKTSTNINLGDRTYGVKGPRDYTFYSFLPQPAEIPGARPSISLIMALPLSKSFPIQEETGPDFSAHPPEVRGILKAWPKVFRQFRKN
ncbi:Zinc finger protein 777 [Dissostichus eleginoides]|uniref:Zinc finger protein 777 n=1 Tax=Dissostichus eleginoides TaxID=100907 RepID=A0AAD9CQ17_DISEL|nr:Zinc finger protein 777 [Dissostichus eleginoides]